MIFVPIGSRYIHSNYNRRLSPKAPFSPSIEVYQYQHTLISSSCQHRPSQRHEQRGPKRLDPEAGIFRFHQKKEVLFVGVHTPIKPHSIWSGRLFTLVPAFSRIPRSRSQLLPLLNLVSWCFEPSSFSLGSLCILIVCSYDLYPARHPQQSIPKRNIVIISSSETIIN
jgi:hypothetical protein